MRLAVLSFSMSARLDHDSSSLQMEATETELLVGEYSSRKNMQKTRKTLQSPPKKNSIKPRTSEPLLTLLKKPKLFKAF